MKNAIVVGIICLVIGFAVGWVAKPQLGGDGEPGKAAAARPERQPAGDQDAGKLATKSGRPMDSGSDDEMAEGPRSIVINNGEVVDEQQLGQYRSHLETKSSGFLGGMMMGVEEEVEEEVEIEGVIE